MLLFFDDVLEAGAPEGAAHAVAVGVGADDDRARGDARDVVAVVVVVVVGEVEGVGRAHSLELLAQTLDLDRVVDLLLTDLLLEEAATEHTSGVGVKLPGGSKRKRMRAGCALPSESSSEEESMWSSRKR
jgi:hypothetical protein